MAKRLAFAAAMLLVAAQLMVMALSLSPGRRPLQGETPPASLALSPLAFPSLEGDGPPVPLASLATGTPFLVNFFGSWCGPCRLEHPFLVQLSASVPIVGIAFEDPPEKTRAFLAEKGNPYRLVLMDLKGQTLEALGIKSVPRTMLVDGTGQVTYMHIGRLTPDIISSELMPRLRQAGMHVVSGSKE